jgi:hypothetical protein
VGRLRRLREQAFQNRLSPEPNILREKVLTNSASRSHNEEILKIMNGAYSICKFSLSLCYNRAESKGGGGNRTRE